MFHGVFSPFEVYSPGDTVMAAETGILYRNTVETGRTTQAVGPPNASYWDEVGARELVYAENATGTVTTVTTGVVDIPGVSITVPANPGVVYVEASAALFQHVAGTGSAFLRILETTSGAVTLKEGIHQLPNVALAYMGPFTFRKRIGPVTSPRLFKLQIAITTADGATVRAANQPSNESYLRAFVQ